MLDSETSSLFPKGEPADYWPESERETFRRIKESLPPGWVAWHSIHHRREISLIELKRPPKLSGGTVPA